MNTRLHKLVSSLAYLSGHAEREWRRQARSHGGLSAVLCYHRVVQAAGRRSAGASVAEGVPAATFEAHIRFMQRHFEPVTAAAVAAAPPDGRLRFAVTFDDGYLDNHDLAAPILRRLGVPATFYVVSNHVGSGRRYWWDLLGEWLHGTGRTEVDLARLLPGTEPGQTPALLPLGDGKQRRRAASQLENLLRPLAPAQVQQAMQRLATALGDVSMQGNGPTPLMDWQQLRTLAQGGFDIGAHSADHLNLAAIDDAELQRQVAGARQTIEAHTGRPVQTFAYPYGGRAHFNARVAAAVRSAGYSAAFTALPGLVLPGQELTELPRVALNWPWGFACAHNLNLALAASLQPTP